MCAGASIYGYSCLLFFLKQGSQGPLGPRGQPGDAVSVYKNTP